MLRRLFSISPKGDVEREIKLKKESFENKH